MNRPTASRRMPAVHPRAAAGAVAAVAVLLGTAVGCTASNHVGSPSMANPGAVQNAGGQQQWPAGMQTMQGIPNAPAGGQGQAAGKNPVALGGFAAATGCAPAAPTAGQQLRQTTCTTRQGSRFAVTAFATRDDQQQWLKATLGGGSFLIGDRWAVGSDDATLRSLQQSLGGTISAT